MVVQGVDERGVLLLLWKWWGVDGGGAHSSTCEGQGAGAPKKKNSKTKPIVAWFWSASWLQEMEGGFCGITGPPCCGILDSG